MSMIPDDIIVDILVKLPARKLRLLRRVSKSWCSLIGSSLFINMHLNHSIITNSNRALVLSNGTDIYCLQVEDLIDGNINSKLSCPRKLSSDLVVFGSCNGLILLCGWYLSLQSICSYVMENFGIWNPNTGEYKSLAEPPQLYKTDYSRSKYVSHGYGFGYDSTRDDYKVVRVTCFWGLHESNTYEADIYSLKSNSWRRIRYVSLPSNMQRINQLCGAFASGALHWTGDAPNKSLVILAFDIERENFSFVAQPDFWVKIRWIEVEEFNGKLWLSSLGEDHLINIWIMREYDVKESWVKLVSVSLSVSSTVQNGSWQLRHYLYNVLARPLLSSGNKILLAKENWEPILYDLATNTEDLIKIKQLNGFFPAHSCVDSLVQLSAYNNFYQVGKWP